MPVARRRRHGAIAIPHQPRLGAVAPTGCLRRFGAVLAAAVLLAVGVARLAARPMPAGAAVVQEQGYRATVDGFTSWYGSYHLGAIGTAWCIDHGIRAPDPDLGYVPTDLPGVPSDLRSALAWVVGRHGPAADRVTAAALMLVAHDLMGATYPGGDLDVDRLPPEGLAGFDGAESFVLGRARDLKAEGLAHGHLRPGWVLELAADSPPPGTTGTVTARLLAGGVPAAGIDLRASAVGALVGGPDREGPVSTLLTGPDGTAATTFVPDAGHYELRVEALLPDLALRAYAPTAARAQRVVRPAVVEVVATVAGVATAPTTAPPASTTTSTSTTSPPTTTTTTTPTSTTTSTSTTRPPTTTTSTTASSPTTTTTTTTAPTPLEVFPATVTAPPTPRTLPRTGSDPLALGAIGSGAVLLGGALRPTRREPECQTGGTRTPRT